LATIISSIIGMLQGIKSYDPVQLQKGCTRLAATSEKVYQFLGHGRWFSPASSTTKTGRHDIV